MRDLLAASIEFSTSFLVMLCLLRGRTPGGTAGEISKATGFSSLGGVLIASVEVAGFESFQTMLAVEAGVLSALRDFLEEIFILIDDCRLVFKAGL